jgi:hypothetical protein
MLAEQSQRWHQLYCNNPAIYPANNDDFYADGQVWADDFSEALNNIALATANPDALLSSDVHIWQINDEWFEFGFKLNENVQIVREEY